MSDLATRLNNLLINKKHTDIEFSFPEDLTYTLSAHCNILSSASSVFETMFYGSLKEAKVVKIEDISPNDFKDMLDFIYTDACTIHRKNVTELLYAADKYLITPLKTKCIDWIKNNLNSNNVFEYMNKIPEPVFEKHFDSAWAIILDETETALESSDFYNISENNFKKLLKMPDLDINELDLFYHAIIWGAKQCENNIIKPTIKNIRSKLHKCEMLIGFPSLDNKQFVECAQSFPGFFTDKEFREISEDIVFKTNVSEFTKIKRSKLKKCVTLDLLEEAKSSVVADLKI